MAHERIGPVSQIFLRAGGFALADIAACSPHEQGRCARIGIAVILAAIFAFLSASYAISSVFDSVALAIALGALWATAIFNLDRLIVSSMVKRRNSFSNIGLALPRLTLAAVLGVVVAVPLELRMFAPEIEAHLDARKQEQKERQQRKTEAELRSLQEQYRADRAKLDLEKNNVELRRAAREQGLSDDLAAKRTLAQDAWKLADCERSGTCGTGRAGEGPETLAHMADFRRQNQLVDETARSNVLQLARIRKQAAEEIAHIDRSIADLEASYAGRRHSIEAVGNSGMLVHAKNGHFSLLARIEALHAITFTRSDAACLDGNGGTSPPSSDPPNTSPDSDGATRAALHPLAPISSRQETVEFSPIAAAEAGTNSEAARQGLPTAEQDPRSGAASPALPAEDNSTSARPAAFYVVGAVSLLFILIETLPVLLKVMTPRGEYDIHIGRRLGDAEEDEQVERHQAELRRDEREAAKIESERKLEIQRQLATTWHERKPTLMQQVLEEIEQAFRDWRAQDGSERASAVRTRLCDIFAQLFNRVTEDIGATGSERTTSSARPGTSPPPGSSSRSDAGQAGDDMGQSGNFAPDHRTGNDPANSHRTGNQRRGRAFFTGLAAYAALACISVAMVAATILAYLRLQKFSPADSTNIAAAVSILLLTMFSTYIGAVGAAREEQLNA